MSEVTTKAPRYVTVVFEINDQEAFEPTWNQIHEQFKWETGHPFRVCAISAADEMGRLNMIEKAFELYDSHGDGYLLTDTVREIMDAVDPMKVILEE